MTKAEAVEEFKSILITACPYGKWFDYWEAQQEWSIFTDQLCKEGKITQKQWATWSTPFKYGRPIMVTVTRDVVGVRADI